MSFLIASFLLVFASFGNEKLATSKFDFTTFNHTLYFVTKISNKKINPEIFLFLLFQNC